MASKPIYTLIAVVGIAAASAAAWYWQHKRPPATNGTAGAGTAQPGPGTTTAGVTPVEVGRVQALRLSDDAQAVGSLRSRQAVVLRPEVSGRIAAINFNDGQRVRRGQLLVQLDDSLQQAQLLQAEAQATIARTNLSRSRELVGQGFVSQSAVDQNGAALQVAEAQVSLAKAQLARMKLLAPFDATVGIKQVHVGDYLKDGADIVSLEDMSSMAVDFRLPERYLARVKVAQPVEVAVDALPGRSFKGRLEAVDAQVDANGRSLLVRARVDNPDAVLRPGMFARPRIVFAVREQALVVPEEALVPLGSRQYIYKIEPDGQNGHRARRIEARLGLRLPGQVELLDGVVAGDRVITAGHARLGQGDTVPVQVIDLGGGRPAAAPASGPAAGASGPNGTSNGTSNGPGNGGAARAPQA